MVWGTTLDNPRRGFFLSIKRLTNQSRHAKLGKSRLCLPLSQSERYKNKVMKGAIMPQDINLSDERILQIFVNKMITEKTPQGLDDGDRDKISRVLIEQLNQRMEYALIAALPDDKLTELNNLLDNNGKDDAIDGVFDNSGVDFDAVSQQTLEAFRQEYLEHGDNAALIKLADEQTAAFLSSAPVGQGHAPDLDAIYAAHADEDRAIDMKYSTQMATVGENI